MTTDIDMDWSTRRFTCTPNGIQLLLGDNGHEVQFLVGSLQERLWCLLRRIGKCSSTTIYTTARTHVWTCSCMLSSQSMLQNYDASLCSRLFVNASPHAGSITLFPNGGRFTKNHWIIATIGKSTPHPSILGHVDVKSTCVIVSCYASILSGTLAVVCLPPVNTSFCA